MVPVYEDSLIIISSSEGRGRFDVDGVGCFDVDGVGCFIVDGVCCCSLREGCSPLRRRGFRGVIGEVVVTGGAEVVGCFGFCCGR